MDLNIIKVIGAIVLALACIVALVIDADDNYVWAAPVLTAIIGYIFGNAQVTGRTGATAPIFSKPPPPPGA